MSPTISLADLYAPIREDLLAAQQIFDAELNSELDFINQMCATVRSYRGKMLRPALLLLSARATGNLTSDHHTLAAVVEMVHMATLVHDDVLDGAERRRQKPTIAATDGNTAAVLLGDYLISHAFHLCSSLPDTFASRRIGATTNVVCEGELMQNRRRGDLTMTQSEYYEIIRRKTAALTAVSCELGARFACSDLRFSQQMHRFGEEAGVAFQIMDDVLDLVGEPETVGKTLGRDLAQGKLTLPLIHALRLAPEADRAILRSALCGESGIDFAQIVSVLYEAGSIEFSMTAAFQHVQTALAQLDRVPVGDARQSLISLAEFISARVY